MRTMAEKLEDGGVHAAAALAAYQEAHRVTGAGNPDPDELACIGDLLADLLHLAGRLADNPDEVYTLVGRAVDHYDYERNPAHADEQV